MTGLIEIMQKRLMDSIRAVRPAGKWKIIVVDSKSIQILNAACKMYDILEENVTLVENIEKPRQPYPTLEALYFLTPCRESVLRLLDDFTAHKPPLYKAAHVYFTSGLNDNLFTDLNRRLKSTGAAQYFLSLKEMYVDFLVSESAVFTVDPSTAFYSVFGVDQHCDPNLSFATMAKQLLSVCVTLGEDPIIRYQVAGEDDPSGRHQRTPARTLATFVQREIDEFCKLNDKFPPPSHPPRPRATLLIVDRSLDPNAPLLHEFTYQAMINDLLPVETNESGNGVEFTYEYHQSDGSMGTKKVSLDEDDNVYKSIRHLHIADCTDRLIEKFNEFLAENKQATQSGQRDPNLPKDTAKSLKDMKEMLSNLPQFQEMKAKYSAHLSIAQECMSFFERHKLSSVANLEQNMATGETPDGEIPKTVVLDMVPLLDDPHVSAVDKTRLLMLYVISKEGGLFDDDKRKLMEHARLPNDLRDALDNLGLLGVKVTRERHSGEKSLKKRMPRKRGSREEETPYELSRYVPTLKKVMDAQLCNSLDSTQFAYTRQTDMEGAGDGGHAVNSPAAVASGVSLRTTKRTFEKRTPTSPIQARSSNGAKLIVFVIGGVTYSEIRSVYELAEMYKRDVYIGSTKILRPAPFVKEMGQLRRPAPPMPNPIPPYTPPSLPKSESHPKTPSILSHVPHMGQSSSSTLSLSGLSLRSGSGTATPEKNSEEKAEKKKKRGLKKFFS
ncbi:Sec1-like protein [Radiomyces spectabilis]|uniref:Sec1-like protein n=1 Tax=Radiomyces spectabilis TaxID=64574 RepID=UPI00221ED466|nr:Sec1-like protein [Radiomyces spectabilis]KAI8384493.1 Sec1-like protein [Radiomyces spectabilis]